MEPDVFIAEVYRRMGECASVRFDPPTEQRIKDLLPEYTPLLPPNKDARILDIGYGDGWFLLACARLGYRNLHGADFNPGKRPYLKDAGITLHTIEKSIISLLAPLPETFDFIHLAHVIEHIPKYSLLEFGDSLNASLVPGGLLMLRTPNMEGPAALSALYVTLGHEYGFCTSNLESLLAICGFENIKFHKPYSPFTLKRTVGKMLRWPFIFQSKIRHRLFGASVGQNYESELVVTAQKIKTPNS